MHDKAVHTTNLLFVSEAARIIGVSPQTIRAWEKTGRLVPQRIAGVRVFLRDEIDRIAAERRAAKARQGQPSMLLRASTRDETVPAG